MALAMSIKTAPVNPFADVPVYSFNEAGQLQSRAMPGIKPKLLFSH